MDKHEYPEILVSFTTTINGKEYKSAAVVNIANVTPETISRNLLGEIFKPLRVLLMAALRTYVNVSRKELP